MRMTIMMKVLALISWCFFTILCESVNADNTSQLGLERQDEAARDDVREWTCPVEHSAADHSESGKWDVFLNSLYCKFSEYEIQKSKRKYNVANIENWGKSDAEPNNKRGIEITKDNFQSFLDKIKKFNIAELDNIRKIKVDGPQLKDLNHVLNLTLKQEIEISCQEPYMCIKGHYIIMSQVKQTIERRYLNRNCKVLLGTGKLKHLNVYALNTAFFDDNISHRYTFKNWSIIARKWQVIGREIFDLRGKNGEPLDERTDSDLSRSDSSLNGADGSPGKPGGPGGNFFGIGEEFLNGKNLQIFVNGGNGSSGEDGENGKNGMDGKTPPQPYNNYGCSRDLCDGDNQIQGYTCERRDECTYGTHGAFTCRFILYGKEGSSGGNGGNGGKGGTGGYPGKVDLIELKSSSGILQFHSVGQNGTDGKGGIGGKGGKNGDTKYMYCLGGPKYKWYTTEDYTKRKGYALSGNNGSPGANSKHIIPPEGAKALSKNDKANSIQQYITYLGENLEDGFTFNFLGRFLIYLLQNDKVKTLLA